jgi:peptidoglycan/xylan/chitin deacetylase (PgdA/CDA1 family)
MAYRAKLLLLSLFITIMLCGCRFLAVEPSTLPIICITFDDQHIGVYDVALPIMTQYNYRGSCFVNSGYIGLSGLMSAVQIVDLYKNHQWEIGGHSLKHEQLTELSFLEAESAIEEDYLNLMALGLAPRSFAIPRGKIPDVYLQYVYDRYRNVRGSSDFAMYQPIDRYNLGYLPFQSGWTADVIKDRVVRGIANHESLIIIGFHRIGYPTDEYGANCPENVFSEIMSYVYEKGLEVLPLDEAVEKLTKY